MVSNFDPKPCVGKAASNDIEPLKCKGPLDLGCRAKDTLQNKLVLRVGNAASRPWSFIEPTRSRTFLFLFDCVSLYFVLPPGAPARSPEARNREASSLSGGCLSRCRKMLLQLVPPPKSTANPRETWASCLQKQKLVLESYCYLAIRI